MPQLVPCVLLLAVEVLLGCVAAAVLDSACASVVSLCIVAGGRGPAGVCCCSSTGFSLCLSCFPVLLLAVEVLLGCVAAAVLDSTCASVGSLCIIAGSRGPAWVSCCSSTGFSLCLSCFPVLLLAVEVLLGCVAAAVLDSTCASVGSLCIIAGSRGPAGVCCCSSTGFSLCLSCFPVLLLAVEVLLGCVAAAVLDSACASVVSLCYCWQ